MGLSGQFFWGASVPTHRKCRCLHLRRALLWPHKPRSLELLNYFDRQMATLKWFLDLESPLLLGDDYAPAPPASPPALLLPETRDRASSI